MKNTAKMVGRLLGFLRALPTAVLHPLGVGLYGRDRALSLSSERIGRIPGNLGVYARQSFYRRRLGGVGADVHFGFMSLLSKVDAKIGDRVYIGRFCTLGHVELGDDVLLADGVQILSGGHQHLPGGAAGALSEGGSSSAGVLPTAEGTYRGVRVGCGAWIGAGAVVMADVGEGAIVGAGAVVVKPVEPGARVGGVPAKVLGQAADRRESLK